MILVSPSILRLKEIMSREPTSDICATAVSVSTGATKTAKRVMEPSINKTESADKITPMPILEVRAIAAIPSITDFE